MNDSFHIPKAPLFPTALRYGVIISGVGIVFTIILYLMDMDTSTLAQVLGYLVLIGGILVGILDYRDNVNEGVIQYGRAIGLGVLIAVVAAFILGIFSIVYMEFINLEMREQILLQQEDQFIEQGMPDEQIEAALDFTRMLLQPLFMVPLSIIIYTFVGALTSSIAGFFIKTD
ncbi:MAG: DUF4199 domain-containing protein [Chitinophagales bacterium]